MKIKYTGNFEIQYNTLVKTNPDLLTEINKRVDWFVKNPKDTRLADHSLKRRMRSLRAFSITDDIRIVYRKTGVNTVRFLAIGRHYEVYF